MGRGFIGLCIILAVGGFIAANIDVKPVSINPKAAVIAAPDHANTVIAASQLNEQWEKTFDKTGKFPERQDPVFHRAVYGSLLNIPLGDENYKAARMLADRFANRQPKIDAVERKARLERVANDVDGRKRFANNLDTNFLKDGRDAHFTVAGSKNTTLEMNYVLINRPFVYKITNETQFLQDAWAAGFKKVIFRSGYGYGSNAWTYDVPKE
jgi:hypothetical protein